MCLVLTFATLTRSASLTEREKRLHEQLQMENAPSFIMEEDLERFDLKDRYLNVFKLSGSFASNTDRSSREYYHCSVTVTSCTFKKSFAFGTGLSVSAGGAIFVSSSQLVITGTDKSKSNFESNSAGTGGSIAGIDCVVSIQYAEFKNNLGFRYAGAIYASAAVDIKIDNVAINRYKIADAQFLMQNAYFESNSAVELGGAVFLQLFGTTYIEGCQFFKNKAGHSGGAAFISKTEPQFFSCQFVGNYAGDRTTAIDNSIYKETLNNMGTVKVSNISNKRRNHRGGLARGGGAIAFNVIKFGPEKTDHSPFPPDHSEPSWDITGGKRRFVMQTSECCFLHNRAFNYDGVGSQIGCSIHLAGPVQYNSIEDHFDLPQSQTISVNLLVVDNVNESFKDSVKATYSFFPFREDAKGSACKTAGDSFSPTDPTIYDSATPATPKPGGTKSYNSSVPRPTSFIYQSTPLTRIPYATTRSHKYTQALTAKNFTIPPDKKPKTKTLIATPSPEPTPEKIPSSSPSLSVSPSRSVSASPSVSMSPEPTVIPPPTPSRSIGKFSRRTNVLTQSPIFVESSYWISHWSYTISHNGEDGKDYTSITFGSFSPWASGGTVLSYTEAYISFLDYSDGEFQIGTSDNTDGQSSLLPIIIGVVAGLLLLIIAALLIWFFVFRVSGSDSSESCVEMAEETVLQVPDSTSAPITNDNPLWTTSVMGDTDDPFRNDFEEDALEGFFNARSQNIE